MTDNIAASCTLTLDSLPDNAVITSAILKIKPSITVGTDPFTTHGDLIVNIKKPFFGIKADLNKSDFEAAADLNDGVVATFDPTPYNGWYSATLENAAFPYVNLAGSTQFRLYFSLDDNDDLSPDYIAFNSGESVLDDQPQLIVTYYVP